MVRSVLRALTPLRLAAAGLALLALTVLILWQVRSDSYLLLPDTAHPVAPPREHRDVRSFGGQRFRAREAEARRGAENDGGTTCEPEIHGRRS